MTEQVEPIGDSLVAAYRSALARAEKAEAERDRYKRMVEAVRKLATKPMGGDHDDIPWLCNCNDILDAMNEAAGE